MASQNRINIDMYRPATYDEMMEIMHGEWMEVLAD